MPLEIRDEKQVPKWTRIEEGILALDPGVRTFVTGYSPSGLAVEWGKGDIGRIYRLCHALDKLQSKWSQKEVRHRRRYKMKRAARRIQKKIRNLVDEMHKKLTRWIVEQHHTVLLPEFETQRMVRRRANRRIGGKTARAMLG
jgi:putative transposase